MNALNLVGGSVPIVLLFFCIFAIDKECLLLNSYPSHTCHAVLTTSLKVSKNPSTSTLP